jgi:hypothetical protein
MLRAGHTAAEAARATGLTKGAISQDAVCAEIIGENKGAKMRKVDNYVKRGVTVKGACAEFNVSISGYCRWKQREEAKNEKLDS